MSPWAWGFFFINADKPQLCEGELLAVLLQRKQFLNFLLPLVPLLADELYFLHPAHLSLLAHRPRLKSREPWLDKVADEDLVYFLLS